MLFATLQHFLGLRISGKNNGPNLNLTIQSQYCRALAEDRASDRVPGRSDVCHWRGDRSKNRSQAALQALRWALVYSTDAVMLLSSERLKVVIAPGYTGSI